MDKDEILVCITNHNYNENALILKNEFSKYFDTIIIDSKSSINEDYFDIKLENVYYSGLINESINQTKIRGKKYLYNIASDVYINDFDKIFNIIDKLPDDVYLWSPSSRGQSHYHCKNFKTDHYREVPYLEGFTFLSHINNFNGLYPISLEKNLYGYGIDLIMGYNCIKKLNKKCVVDDRVEIYHKEGTGYNQNKALNDMYNWIFNTFNDDIKKYIILYNKSWNMNINSSDYKKLLEYLKL